MWWFVVLWYGSFELVSVWYCWVEWQLWRDTLSHWCNVFFLFLSNRHRVDQHDNRGDRHHLLLHWQVWKETQTKWKTEEANHTDISRWVCFRVVCELWATQFTHTHIFKQLTDVFEYLCQRPSHISPTYPHKHTHKHKHNTPPSHPHIHTRSSQLTATAHNAHTWTTRLSHTQTNSSTTCRCHTATVIVTASSNIRQHTNYYHVNLFHSLPFTEPGATPDTASPSSTTPDDDDLYIYYIDKSGKRRRRPRPRATPSDTPTSSTPVTGSVKRESHT